jgi:Xaa-Pro aminopeptidase
MSAEATKQPAYAERIARAQAAMEQQGIDWLLIAPSSDLVYLAGYHAHVSERLNALVVPRRGGEPFMVVPQLEAPRLAGRHDLTEMLDIRGWADGADPIEVVARGVGDYAGKTIAVSDQMWSGFLLKLMAACPGARFINADEVLRELRAIKGPDEIAYMREAGKRTDQVWEEFIATATVAGKTEIEVGRELAAIMARHGLGEPAFMIVASGPASASPHHATSERRLQEGDAVVCDFGGNIEGYKSDITRTAHVGEPTDEFRKVYAIVDQARQAAFAAVRPGVPCAALDTAAREVITAAGYGDYFIHRVGHGLGLDVHEAPYMVGNNSETLRPGMVFSDEPGIYLPGKFGIRIEDTVVCTEDGGELLNNATRELAVLK